ncbi:OLC1v1001390C1 [Oldenlandia corymbosa var. corymbosa]|uniref:U-box domain-containing protein n=1 Tax=Oldenlandia corymbosa var. corymbosa TaxID=529605 RepID=A0AAV1D7P8_OLDCO|nr:OLC1v1001390C1 [Oldenlandia corymbosa var. corymbosa]
MKKQNTCEDLTTMDFPEHFRCPISMELMKDPVTICTGVTYERKFIEKWLITYEKKTCPATMQPVESLEMTPNHTLKRLIQVWQDGRKSKSSGCSSSSSPARDIRHEELVSLLRTIESTPFKVSPLKKLRSMVEVHGDDDDDEMRLEFKKSGGVEVVIKILVQILVDSGSDFSSFRASEEAIGLLNQLIQSTDHRNNREEVKEEEEDHSTFELLMKPECIKSFTIMLQRGSADTRFSIVSLFQKMAKSDRHWNHAIIKGQGIDFFKSLLEIVSDEMSGKASSCALQVLIDVLDASKRSRVKAIEAGAVCTLIELLPDSNKSKCERIMLLLKVLCECAEGRLAFIEHGLGVSAISKKMWKVSSAATKLGVKILWLICGSNPTERVLEEMLMCGTVKKLVVLLHMGGSSSTKNRIVRIFKCHSNFWKKYPCFPSDVKEYLGLGHDVC